MARAASISLSKFTASVDAAVKAAVERHPKFKVDPPRSLAISYLIRGLPVPEAIVANATFRETQAFAADVAAHITREMPQVAEGGRAVDGAIFSQGSYLIVGIPAPIDILLER
jgi:hypothetical protein